LGPVLRLPDQCGADFRKVGHGGTRPGRGEVHSGARRSNPVGHRRLAHFSLRTARRRYRRPSQPDSRTGRRRVAVQTQLGHLGLAGNAPGVGRDCASAAVDAVRPRGRRAETGGKYDREFRTKHQLGVKLSAWFMKSIRTLGVDAKVWLVVDGAYAARPFLLPVLELGTVVVSRLRKGTPACLTCLLRVLTATASMARTKSVWPSVPDTAKVGAPSPIIATASR